MIVAPDGQINILREHDAQPSPYWWETAPPCRDPAPDIPHEIDVAIVGSGYTGMSAALTLSRAGRSVVVFEQGDIGCGASTRNGGAVGDTLRISFSKMLDKFGHGRAVAFYQGVREAREYLELLIEREGIECHYARVGRFIGAHKPADYEALARDLEVRHRMIGFDAEMVPEKDVREVIGSDVYHGGRLVHTDGNLHPALFHRGLLIRAIEAGALVAPQTPVVRISRADARFRVEFGGGSLRARDVIVATNGYTGRASSWLSRRLIPIQSQIIGTAPLAGALVERLIPKRRQMGDTRRLHNYFRTSPDGTRILFGGRAGAGAASNPERSALHLHRQMVDVFPALAGARITHAWSGYIAYTFDSLPHMTAHDGMHYVAGCCGSGVAMAPYLGHKAALKVLQSPEAATPFDQAYATFPGYGGKPWFLPAVYWYFGLRDRYRW
jgi:glycine/D-amino acid oxidase-like deaminating enzyme